MNSVACLNFSNHFNQILKGPQKLLFLFLTGSIGQLIEAYEGRFSIRAREHFEWYDIETPAGSAEYQGLTNTINLWWERPFYYSLGLAVGPVIGGANASNSSTKDILASDIKLWTVGLEGKYFPFHKDQIKGFVRLGLSWHHLTTSKPERDFFGWGQYVGAGWEIPFGRVSVAPEVALRFFELSQNIKGQVVTPSIGFHFYKDI